MMRGNSTDRYKIQKMLHCIFTLQASCMKKLHIYITGKLHENSAESVKQIDQSIILLILITLELLNHWATYHFP
jgi:hypothetical protein